MFYTYRISNELTFITKFITWVGKHDIMRGSAVHNIIFANEWPWYVLSCLLDDAYKRTLAANRKE